MVRQVYHSAQQVQLLSESSSSSSSIHLCQQAAAPDCMQEQHSLPRQCMHTSVNTAAPQNRRLPSALCSSMQPKLGRLETLLLAACAASYLLHVPAAADDDSPRLAAQCWKLPAALTAVTFPLLYTASIVMVADAALAGRYMVVLCWRGLGLFVEGSRETPLLALAGIELPHKGRRLVPMNHCAS
jgi:hypothetical protein